MALTALEAYPALETPPRLAGQYPHQPSCLTHHSDALPEVSEVTPGFYMGAGKVNLCLYDSRTSFLICSDISPAWKQFLFLLSILKWMIDM